MVQGLTRYPEGESRQSIEAMSSLIILNKLDEQLVSDSVVVIDWVRMGDLHCRHFSNRQPCHLML